MHHDFYGPSTGERGANGESWLVTSGFSGVLHQVAYGGSSFLMIPIPLFHMFKTYLAVLTFSYHFLSPSPLQPSIPPRLGQSSRGYLLHRDSPRRPGSNELAGAGCILPRGFDRFLGLRPVLSVFTI